MNLNDLYKPIGRLYEEVPSADYAGDYLAANGGWNNATEEDTAVESAKAALASNGDLIKQYEAEYTDKYKNFGTGCNFHYAVEKVCRSAKQKQLTFLSGITKGPIAWLGIGTKGCYSCPGGVLGYDNKETLDNYLKNLSSAISDLKSKTPALQTAVKKAIDDKNAATMASQETKSKTLELEKAKTEAEAKKKVEESKQKQTEAELRAKKIFLAIIASGLILSAAGFALLRK